MSKLWAGRTSGEVSSIADDFNSSIRFDCKLYKQDITGSMAHAAMLGAQGIISQAEAGQLIDGLQGILSDLESGALEFDFGCEDIHMFVEQVLTQRLGDVGKKLHTARSSRRRKIIRASSCPATPICSGRSPSCFPTT